MTDNGSPFLFTPKRMTWEEYDNHVAVGNIKQKKAKIHFAPEPVQLEEPLVGVEKIMNDVKRVFVIKGIKFEIVGILSYEPLSEREVFADIYEVVHNFKLIERQATLNRWRKYIVTSRLTSTTDDVVLKIIDISKALTLKYPDPTEMDVSVARTRAGQFKF